MAMHPVIRSLHDVGLSAWTGGSLMGAVGLNGAAATLTDPDQRASASTAGWSRWAPVNAAALGSHLVGATGLLVTEWPRVRTQKGVAASTAAKTAATGLALGVGVWSAVLNRKMAASVPVPVAGSTEPAADTPPDVAKTLRQLKVSQWLNPAVGAGLIVLAAWQGEQQRADQVAAGRLQRLLAVVPKPAVSGPVAAAGALALLLVARRRRASQAGDEVVEIDVVEVDEVLAVTSVEPVVDIVEVDLIDPGPGA